MKNYVSVNAHITDAEPAVREKLREIRHLVKKTVPDAKEGIAYGMPAYSWRSKPLFYFAAMKGHLGLYPTPGPIPACRHLFGGLIASKGCVRVPYTKRIPKTLVMALLRERRKEIRGTESREVVDAKLRKKPAQ